MSDKNPLREVIRRAVEDPDFRERLTADPARTWEEATGMSVPDDIEIVVLENSPRTVNLVLPSADLASKDLDDLQAVGGHHDAFSWSGRRQDMVNLGGMLCTQELWESW